jgi:hypothetical protein
MITRIGKAATGAGIFEDADDLGRESPGSRAARFDHQLIEARAAGRAPKEQSSPESLRQPNRSRQATLESRRRDRAPSPTV